MTNEEALALRVGSRVCRMFKASTGRPAGIRAGTVVAEPKWSPGWSVVRLVVHWDGNKHREPCGAHWVDSGDAPPGPLPAEFDEEDHP